MPNKLITLYIADDHQLVIDGLKVLLNQSGLYQMVGEANDGITAENEILAIKPDIVLLDLKMPGRDGMQVIQSLIKQHCQSKIIVLSMHEDGRFIRDAELFGAKGYLLKNCGRTELTEAIEKVINGKTCFHNIRHKQGIVNIFFTPRETDVIQLIFRGLSNPEIALKLYTSEATVKVHRRNIREKTGTTNTIELIKKLNDLGFNFEL